MKANWLDRTLLEGAHFTLCLTEKQYNKALKHLQIPLADRPPFLLTPQANATVHYFVSGGKQCHIVCLGAREGKTLEQILALLVHEAVHMWQEFKYHIGESSPGRETEAYAIQSLSQSLMTEYLRQTGGKR